MQPRNRQVPPSRARHRSARRPCPGQRPKMPRYTRQGHPQVRLIESAFVRVPASYRPICQSNSREAAKWPQLVTDKRISQWKGVNGAQQQGCRGGTASEDGVAVVPDAEFVQRDVDRRVAALLRNSGSTTSRSRPCTLRCVPAAARPVRSRAGAQRRSRSEFGSRYRKPGLAVQSLGGDFGDVWPTAHPRLGSICNLFNRPSNATGRCRSVRKLRPAPPPSGTRISGSGGFSPWLAGSIGSLGPPSQRLPQLENVT